MIAGVRQFKLINALGREYDMTRPDALLHAPDGLGWGTERTVNRLGMTYIGINEKEIHQSPSGEMVFRTYEEYGRFLSFCQQGGLVLCYKPIDTWYYCECLISIQKSEIQWENNHLICPVQFTLLSYWYEKVVAQTAEPPEPVEPTYATVTGDPAVFNARYSYPIKDLSVAIQGSQELNGYSKPWVGGAGKNLSPPISEWSNGYWTSQGVLVPQIPASLEKAYEGYIAVLPQTAYTISIELDGELPSGGYIWQGFCTYNANKEFIARTTKQERVGVTRLVFSFTTDASTYFIRPSCRTYGLTTTVQIEQGSTATAYEPYENICPITSYTSVNITQTGSQTNTYAVELTGAGNVYKGTLDVTTGELVVDRVVHGGSEFSNTNIGINPSGTSGDGKVYNCTITTWMPVTTGQDQYACISNLFSTSVASGVGRMVKNGNNLYVVLPSSVTSNTLARQWLIDNDAQFCFPITPQTYQLTPVQLSNLIGSNTIQADAGAVTVTYRTDARTEYKIYPYQYSYRYGDTAQNVFDISCDLPSYFKLTVFGEATNPSWRVVQNGSIVKSGKLNATIGSSQKLVINTDPKQTEIALYTLSNTRINNLYGYSDFATERIFALPQGESQVQVLTEDEQSPKVMIEVLKHV